MSAQRQNHIKLAAQYMSGGGMGEPLFSSGASTRTASLVVLSELTLEASTSEVRTTCRSRHVWMHRLGEAAGKAGLVHGLCIVA